MPKKTTHSRSGAQHGRTKQKSFELVRPISDKNVLEAVKSDEEAEVVTSGAVEIEEVEMEEVEVQSEPEKVPAAIATDKAPKSAASRLAARRQAAQKAQRTPVSLISAEHYGYVRKDLAFILVLAIIMFSAIIIMHFVPAIGG